MEEKQERLTQDLQNLMTEITRHCPPHDGASNHSGDRKDSNGRREGRRNQRAAHGEGRRHSRRNDDESEDEANATASNSVLVADVIEDATMKKDLAN